MGLTDRWAPSRGADGAKRGGGGVCARWFLTLGSRGGGHLRLLIGRVPRAPASHWPSEGRGASHPLLGLAGVEGGGCIRGSGGEGGLAVWAEGRSGGSLMESCPCIGAPMAALGLGGEGRQPFLHLLEVLGWGLCGGSSCTGRAGAPTT